jgi:hypothetical protein
MGRQMAVPIRRSSRWGGKARRTRSGPKESVDRGRQKGASEHHAWIGARIWPWVDVSIEVIRPSRASQLEERGELA